MTIVHFKNVLRMVMQYSERHPRFLFLVITFLVGFESFGLGTYSWVTSTDAVEFITRYVSLSGYGLFTKWNPGALMGVEFVIDIWHVATVFFTVLPAQYAHMALTALSLFLAGFFLYRLLKVSLDLSHRSSVIGAVIFMITLTFDRPWAAYGMAILPMVSYYADRLLTAHSPRPFIRYFGYFGLGLLTAAFAPAITSLPYILIGIFFFVVINHGITRKSIWCIGLLTFASALPHLSTFFYTRAISQLSYRLSEAQLLNSQPALHVIKVSLELYGIPLLLALGVFFATRKYLPSRLYAWLKWGPLVVLLLIFVAPLEPHQTTWIKHIVGFVSGVSSARAVFILPFFVSIILACVLGASSHIRFVSLRIRSAIGTALALLMIAGIFTQQFNVKTGVFANWILTYDNFSFLRNRDLKELYNREQQNNAPFRVSMPVGGMLSYPIVSLYGFETIEGYISLPTARLRNFWRIINKSGRQFERDLGFNYAPNKQQSPADSYLANIANLPLLGFANVKYIFSPIPFHDKEITLVNKDVLARFIQEPIFEPNLIMAFKKHPTRETFSYIKKRIRENFTSPEVFIYENPYYTVRFFLVDSIAWVESEQELLGRIATSTPYELKKAVLLADDQLNRDAISVLEDRFSYAPARDSATSTAKLLVYRAEQIVFSVNISAPQMLVVTNNYSPYWKVKVDGEDAPVIPAYGFFWGIALKPGEYDVVFTYEPPTLFR